MKIVYNRIIPFGKQFLAINLFGVLFAKGPCDGVTVNHEMIHTAQIKELLYLPFYIVYLLEWLWRIIIHRNYMKAYHAISFEREAYANQRDMNYLNNRKRFAFLKYL